MTQTDASELPPGEYAFHPLCLKFPAYGPADYARRRADYEAHPERAVDTAVVLAVDEADGEWKIADGRHHYLICRELGYEVRYHQFAGTRKELAALVLARNAHRRHETESQRAASIAAVMSWERGGDHGNQHTVGKAARAALPTPKTQAEVAAEAGISTDTLQRAAKVEKMAPEVLPAVRDGKLDAKTAAKVADLPAEERVAIISAPDPKAAAKAALRSKGEAAGETWRSLSVDSLAIPDGAVTGRIKERCTNAGELADLRAAGDDFGLARGKLLTIDAALDGVRGRPKPPATTAAGSAAPEAPVPGDGPEQGHDDPPASPSSPPDPTPATVDDPPLDRLGRPLPPHLIPVFEVDGEEVKKLRDRTRAINATLTAVNKLEHVGGLKRRNPGLEAAADALADGLTRELPHCVCPECGGRGPAECLVCGGAGWLRAGQFEHLPAELKAEAMRHAPGDGWEPPEPTPPGPPPAAAQPGPGLDCVGRPIPPKLRDYFADTFLAAVAADLDRLAGSVESCRAWNPWIDSLIADNLRDKADDLRNCLAYAVCTCRGKGCAACQMCGFVPASQKHAPDLKRAA